MFSTAKKLRRCKGGGVVCILICILLLLWLRARLAMHAVKPTVVKTNPDLIEANQEDPGLVEILRKLILPPSGLPYSLNSPLRRHYSQVSQDAYADYLLKEQRGGFFIEVGAGNGEDLSNSLFLEKTRGWSGLLVEPDPTSFSALSDKHRKAYSLNVGLSLNTTSYYAKFKPNAGLGRITSEGEDLIRIKTFPLFTMLLALNVSTVDFLSLDIEGDELKVLRSVPWSRVIIRLLCVEVKHHKGGPRPLIRYMKEQGYTFLGVKDIDAWFAHPSFKKHL
ncbi:hypothetical protein SK128_010331 [Halocaridina rubra]|uniref:Methyltransferase FkbM domain-containing protein n=1 Tax=Halocaridina rubra TaxID=373956 RepID=A0AAN8XAA4_HALRR